MGVLEEGSKGMCRTYWALEVEHELAEDGSDPAGRPRLRVGR